MVNYDIDEMINAYLKVKEYISSIKEEKVEDPGTFLFVYKEALRLKSVMTHAVKNGACDCKDLTITLKEHDNTINVMKDIGRKNNLELPKSIDDMFKEMPRK
jgi:hypothetical protein